MLYFTDCASAGLRGLGSYTKALAISAFGTEVLHGATQWDSTALYIHTKFGPLDGDGLHSAHSDEFTLTYSFEVTDAALRNAGGEEGVTVARQEPQFFLHRAEEGKSLNSRMQLSLGANFVFPAARSPPGQEDFVPIHEK